ncbi:CPBP family intramembrane glutamic endopeptidase [Jeotgalibacillus soli]|uniref:CAAX prenyl protease 2/Lysostaphin resistance protein A-like domain-containing protein n=1 Tax=Jeotgalibacillus soli TaxID=889306 RepID=A0A0C2W1V1_9BACL|nr:CPBP family intramembrane glutamic endopeptidase [Jeotgalibacillus soli]KIL50596.1 hypothetical protein KP78_05970 [Jeotgalibacillus soli]
MNRTYLYIIIAYVVMQLSGLVGPMLIFFIGNSTTDTEPAIMENIAIGYWIFISFAVNLIVTLLLLQKKKGILTLPGQPSEPIMVGVWAFAGIFIAFFSQAIAASIESLIGIEAGSENTAQIIDLLSYAPIAAFSIAIFGPILEEIVFRGIIFGSLYRKFNFFISALLSSVIFAVIHMDFEHLLIYTAMGFAFAFLYVMTKRIIVPIIAHIAMNTIVVLTQFVFAEQLQQFIEENAAVFIWLWSWLGGLT